VFNANGANTTFFPGVGPDYGVQLVVSRGAVQSAPRQFVIHVDSGLPTLSANVRFAQVKSILQAATPASATFPDGCLTCHYQNDPTPPPPHLRDMSVAMIPPMSFAEDGRNTRDPTNSVFNDLWFYTQLRGKINLKQVELSSILRKPAGQYHGGSAAPMIEFNRANAATRANYDLILNWIYNGTPYQ
jgi:hypothetical protein